MNLNLKLRSPTRGRRLLNGAGIYALELYSIIYTAESLTI